MPLIMQYIIKTEFGYISDIMSDNFIAEHKLHARVFENEAIAKKFASIFTGFAADVEVVPVSRLYEISVSLFADLICWTNKIRTYFGIDPLFDESSRKFICRG